MGAAPLWGETPAAVGLTAVVWVGVTRCGGRAGTICASLGLGSAGIYPLPATAKNREEVTLGLG